MAIILPMERIENFVERCGFDSLDDFAEDYEVKAEKRISNVLNEIGVWGLVKTDRKSLVHKNKISIIVSYGSFLNESLSLCFLMREIIHLFLVKNPYKHKVRFYVEMSLSLVSTESFDSVRSDGIIYTFYYD